MTPDWGTFPGYEDPVRGGDRIDWVVAGGPVEVLRVAINTYRENGRYPSDHAPAQAEVRLA